MDWDSKLRQNPEKKQEFTDDVCNALDDVANKYKDANEDDFLDATVAFTEDKFDCVIESYKGDRRMRYKMNELFGKKKPQVSKVDKSTQVALVNAVKQLGKEGKPVGDTKAIEYNLKGNGATEDQVNGMIKLVSRYGNDNDRQWLKSMKLVSSYNRPTNKPALKESKNISKTTATKKNLNEGYDDNLGTMFKNLLD